MLNVAGKTTVPKIIAGLHFNLGLSVTHSGLTMNRKPIGGLKPLNCNFFQDDTPILTSEKPAASLERTVCFAIWSPRPFSYRSTKAIAFAFDRKERQPLMKRSKGRGKSRRQTCRGDRRRHRQNREKRESGPPSENGQRVRSPNLTCFKIGQSKTRAFSSRDFIVFDFEPNPDFDYKNAKAC